MNGSDFERVYDKYCPMLYGIALKICNSKIKAKELLTTTFRKINKEDINQEKYPAYCITLIRLIIKTGEKLYPEKFKNNFRLTQFEHTPVINHLLFGKATLQDYCKENAITREQAFLMIRNEFSRITNFGKEDKNSIGISVPEETACG